MGRGDEVPSPATTNLAVVSAGAGQTVTVRFKTCVEGPTVAGIRHWWEVGSVTLEAGECAIISLPAPADLLRWTEEPPRAAPAARVRLVLPRSRPSEGSQQQE